MNINRARQHREQACVDALGARRKKIMIVILAEKTLTLDLLAETIRRECGLPIREARFGKVGEDRDAPFRTAL